jgi:hypothetical protein
MVQIGVMFGATGYIIYTISGGARHSANGRGIDRYYYSSFDPISAKLQRGSVKSFTGIRTDVDRYEMDMFTDQQRMGYRGYAETNKYVVSFHVDKNPKTVEIVWFPRN